MAYLLKAALLTFFLIEFLFVVYVQMIFPVVIATGFHLFPFRTEKLSPPAPMVLHTRGRVGHRHFQESLSSEKNTGSLFLRYSLINQTIN